MSTIGSIVIWVILGLVVGLPGGLILGRRWGQHGHGSDFAETEATNLRRHLTRAQRMEALGILSGSIMHNLNNLLSVVLGQARMAREDLASDTAAWHNLGQVIQAAESAAELSREVDSYHSDDDHDRRPTRLQPVVRSTVKLLRDILPDTVTIETELDPACGPVLASPTQMQQVLMSLCSNAYHAMFRRRGSVTIMLASANVEHTRPAVPRDLTPGHYVRLSVADNGRGMSADTLRQIFQPYFSARAPRRGAGLGLTMVARLLAANEGVTVATSLPGHGTQFDIFFPLIARGLKGSIDDEKNDAHLRLVGPEEDQASLDAYQAPAVAPVVATTKSTATGRAPAVLLVEDDAMVSATVRACLERAQMHVTSFEDGAHAVRAFASDPGAFDLLLTDQFMRGLDGREVVTEMRRIRPQLPVIIMSGHPDGILEDDVAPLNLAGTLAKPFKPSQLLELVTSALRDKRLDAFKGKA